MAAADVAARPVEQRQRHKRPFASWVKRLTNLNKSGDSNSRKFKKASKNNPYPESGHPNYRPNASSSTNEYTTPPTSHHPSRDSYSSITESSTGNGHHIYNSSRSAAPTVATNNETIHSDAGYSRALTGTTAGGALSSVDGRGANSTFSSPNQSTHSLTTTLTTIQSSNALGPGPPQSQNNTTTSSPNSHTGPAVQFTHQYPVAASAIPTHLQAPGSQQHQPTTYHSATANSLLTDNASILTLASSSKRRRRSMDTDASVRALAPHSVWGDSRESLPLSVLSGNMESSGGRDRDRDSNMGVATAIRPGHFANERASVYSNTGVSAAGVSAPALTSERNSFYASSHKASTFRDRDGRDGTDGRSVRSIQIHSQPSAPTSNPSSHLTETKYTTGPGYDGGSLRGYEGSIRSGALGGGHGRGDSVSGSPVHSPSIPRRPSGPVSLSGASLRENSILEDREGHF